MVDLIFLVDESGAKSNSNKEEKEYKEFGVMAGFILYDLGYNFLKNEAKTLILPLSEKYKKVHLTDLEYEEKREIVDLTFKKLSEFGCHWLYTAIYTQGWQPKH